MGCSTPGSVAKVGSRGHKSRKKRTKMLGQFHIPKRTYYIPACLDQDSDLTWGQDDFLHNKTGNYHDKPQSPNTSRIKPRQAIMTNQQDWSIFPTHLIDALSRDQPKLYKPLLAVQKHHLSLQRCQLHIRGTLYTNLGYFCFY